MTETPDTTADVRNNAEKSSAICRLKSSMIVWLVALFIISDIGFGFLLPQQPEKLAHREKLEQFFFSDRHPDILLFGSSVALASSHTADKAKGYVSPKIDRGNYLELVDLSQLIFERTSKRFSAGNLSLFGSMTSDTWMAAAKTVEFKKAPKVAIYETVSRDLFDASMGPIGESPYYGYLSSVHPNTEIGWLPAPVVRLFDGIIKSKLLMSIALLCEDDQIFCNSDRLRKSIDSVFCSLSQIYGNRVAVSDELTKHASEVLHRGTTVHNAALQYQIENKKKNPFAKLAASAPATFEVDERPQLQRYEQERVYFLKLIRLCKKNGIKLVVVNMPTREGYKSLIPNGLRGLCPKETYDLARAAGVEVIDLDRNLLQATDYIDLGHLNERGAVKLNVLLADELARRHIFDDVLSSI